MDGRCSTSLVRSNIEYYVLLVLLYCCQQAVGLCFWDKKDSSGVRDDSVEQSSRLQK